MGFYHLPSSPEICGSGLQNNMIAPHTGYHVNDTLWYTVIVIVAIVTVAMVTIVQEATCPLVSVFLSAVLSSPTELPVRREERSCHRCSLIRFLTSILIDSLSPIISPTSQIHSIPLSLKLKWPALWNGNNLTCSWWVDKVNVTIKLWS